MNVQLAGVPSSFAQATRTAPISKQKAHELATWQEYDFVL